MTIRRLAAALLGAAALAGAGAAVAATSGGDGVIGPQLNLLGNGRRLHPYGRLVRVGNFPTGGRLTRDGRWFWTVSTGRGVDDVQIVSVRTGRVVQRLRLPGASGGIAMDPAHPIAYVSGVADSEHRDLRSPPGTPGTGGDVVHVFTYNERTGRARWDHLIAVPPPSDAPAEQSFPPTPTTKGSWPDRLAVSANGSTLLVPLNLADAAAIVDTRTRAVRYVSTGAYPYGAAILPGGRTGLVSNEGPGTVSVIDLASGTKVKDIQVGPNLSHPEAIALDPHAARAYVTLANSDEVVVIDTRAMTVARTLSVERPEGLGASPVDAKVTPDGLHLLVATEGTDEIVVFRLPRPRGNDSIAKRELLHRGRIPVPWTVEGRIPTAEMPMAVDVAPPRQNACGFGAPRRGRGAPLHCEKLVYVSGKDLGTGPNPRGPEPNSPLDTDDAIASTQYLPLLNIGAAGIADFPSPATLARITPIARTEIHPVNASERPPAGTPLRPGGPIKHVFYIVRENRTYDQVLGDLGRGDGDPKLTLFGANVTPNAHALADRFPLVDHVYANSEASIDGHFWTSAAQVSDYVHKAWFANYAGRGRPYDFGVYSITWPGNGFLFDQAQRQGISYFNYGEAIAGTVPLTDKDRTSADTAEVAAKFAHSDLGPSGGAQLSSNPAGQCYPNDASIATDAILGAAKQNVQVFDTDPPLGAPPGSESRFDCFRARFTAQVATGSVPAFNYMVLSNDHTRTLEPGQRTPDALVADNDEGLGRIVDEISHSPIWSSSAIFVVEDDSQDGADHVDAHRIPALVISPYARRGAIVHTRYDLLSVVRSVELIVGMHPLGLWDADALPMYDAFQSTPSNAEPYSYIPAKVNLLATNPSNTAGARLAASLPHCLDCITQQQMDALLWKYRHGMNAVPPPPGPNASAQDVSSTDAGEGAAATATARHAAGGR